MNISPTVVIPLVKKLGDFLKLGAEHYVTMRAAGVEPDPDVIAIFVAGKMDGWDPAVRGRKLLDDETKAACARFLAGVAFNVAAAQPQEDAA